MLAVPDHFNRQLSPLLALLEAAHVTTNLRLAPVVLDNDYRHPAVVAKEAATLDVLSGGRLEFGFGAGWMERDYQQSGIPFDPPGVRLARFIEAVAICKQFFRQDTVTFDGVYYQVRDLPAFPKPAQAHLPFMIGARNRRMLRFAAREADIVAIANSRPAPDGLPPTFAEKVGWVREAAAERYPDIELHAMVFDLEITDRPKDALERVSRERQLPVEYVTATPATLVGSINGIIEQLLAWRETYDVSYYVFAERQLEEAAPIVKALAGQ